MLVDLRGIMVIFKPPGWEVDSSGSNTSLALSTFVQERLPKETYPLAHTFGFGYGFLHRLDVPSSGLVLAGKNFEGLYWLRFQLNIYRLCREYMVICRGIGPPAIDVDARVDVSTTRVQRTAVDDSGQPARTHIRVPAHLLRGSGWCIVTVSIHTGRRHQIRAHTRHIGHPSAADPWYSPSACIVAANRGLGLLLVT